MRKTMPPVAPPIITGILGPLVTCKVLAVVVPILSPNAGNAAVGEGEESVALTEGGASELLAPSF